MPFVEVDTGSDAAADVAAVALELAVAEAANSAETVAAAEEPVEAGWRHRERYKFLEWSEQRQLGGSHEGHLG